MDKLIIENKSEMTMSEALRYAINVIDQGRISANNTQYCYVTEYTNDKVIVYAAKNKKSDKLIICDKCQTNSQSEKTD